MLNWGCFGKFELESYLNLWTFFVTFTTFSSPKRFIMYPYDFIWNDDFLPKNWPKYFLRRGGYQSATGLFPCSRPFFLLLQAQKSNLIFLEFPKKITAKFVLILYKNKDFSTLYILFFIELFVNF